MAHEGEQFLHKQDGSLHHSAAVELAAELENIQRSKEGQALHTKPADKIADWLEVLEHTHTGKGHTSVPRGWERNQPEVLERIKASYHKQHVIKSEAIPEAVYQAEARIARRLGHGDVPITDEYRQQKAAEVIANQQASLDRWVDYLSSPDAQYPAWAKYWAFTAVTGMGRLEKQIDEKTGRGTTRFSSRDHTTAAPFPPLNARALALSIGAIEAQVAHQQLSKAERSAHPVPNSSTRLDEAEFKKLLLTESFPRLYAQFLSELPAYSAEGLRETRGEWVKYDKGSDPKPLVKSLEGHPLEWCTANLETARTHLKGGDFHVYYSIDEMGQPTIPRIAIRMEGNQIAEVRGIAPNQNLDPYISEVVQAKMNEFSDGAAYQKKAADMHRLTEVEDRLKSGAEPSIEDLRFLYEIDASIDGFGYGKDPRIEELLEGRARVQDLSLIFNCDPGQISVSYIGAISGTPERPIVYHYGGLFLDGHTPPNTQLPQRIGGDFSWRALTKAEGLVLPPIVDGSLRLPELTSAQGLRFPKVVTKDLELPSLTSAEGLVLPETVGGILDLYSLTNATGLDLTHTSVSAISLSGMSSAEGLVLPRRLTGMLNLHSLTHARGLALPEFIGGNLILQELSSTDELRLPRHIGGYLDLNSLESLAGVQLPEHVGASLYLDGLNKIQGVTLPGYVGGAIYLAGIDDVYNLSLPQGYKGSVYLSTPAHQIRSLVGRYPDVTFDAS
jgi:hypothetical protein